jgi:hypothetical protein
MIENTAGSQFDENERNIIKNKIMDTMKCSVCGSAIFLMCMNDGDTIGCTIKPFEHISGWSIDFQNMKIVRTGDY